MNIGNIIAKGVGAASLYFVARDAHVWGKIKSDEFMVTKNADAAAYYMENTMSIDKPSLTKSKLKEKVFHLELMEPIRGYINSTRGYFRGLFSSLVSNVIPFGLGLSALLTKGRVSKGSAIALGAIGVYTLIRDGLGIGTTKDLTLPTK